MADLFLGRPRSRRYPKFNIRRDIPFLLPYTVKPLGVTPAEPGVYLNELGIPALPAHLFILYFSILSMVTPPVALSAYAAAGISGGNLWNTGVRAFVLAVPGFLIPYAFAINPAMLLQGPLLESAAVIIPALIGVIALAAASGGYAFGPLGTIMRVALFCAAPLMIAPDRTTDFAGGAVILFVLAYQIWRFKIAGQEKTSSLPN